jgi:hypothetical protein
MLSVFTIFLTPRHAIGRELVTSIEPLAVADVQPLQRPAQIAFGQFEKQVVVIRHQNKGVHFHSEDFCHLGDQVKEMLSVAILPINGAAFIASGGHMIPASRQIDP